MSKSSMPAKCSLKVLANIVPHIDPVGEMGAVFMLIPVFGPNPDSLPSPFGQGAGVSYGCGLGRPYGGKTTMAKVLNEAARGCEPAHLMLSPSVRPVPWRWRIVTAEPSSSLAT